LLTQQKILESNTRMANSTAALVLKQEAAIERKSAKETAAINKKIQEEEKANRAITAASQKRLQEEQRIQKAILTAAEERIKKETLAEDLKNKKAALAAKLRADVEQSFARNTASVLRRLNEETAARMQGNATAQIGMFSRMRQGLSSLMQLFGVYSAMMLAHRAIMGTIRFEKKLSDDVAQLAIYLDNSTENATKLYLAFTTLGNTVGSFNDSATALGVYLPLNSSKGYSNSLSSVPYPDCILVTFRFIIKSSFCKAISSTYPFTEVCIALALFI